MSLTDMQQAAVFDVAKEIMLALIQAKTPLTPSPQGTESTTDVGDYFITLTGKVAKAFSSAKG